MGRNVSCRLISRVTRHPLLGVGKSCQLTNEVSLIMHEDVVLGHEPRPSRANLRSFLVQTTLVER